MILRFPVLVHSVMEKSLSFLLIYLRWGRYGVLGLVYILLVVSVSRTDAEREDLVLKYMVFGNYVDQRAACRAKPMGDFRYQRVECNSNVI
jgi:hypothetical protein